MTTETIKTLLGDKASKLIVIPFATDKAVTMIINPETMSSVTLSQGYKDYCFISKWEFVPHAVRFNWFAQMFQYRDGYNVPVSTIINFETLPEIINYLLPNL